MKNLNDVVVDVVALNDREIVTKVRFQKTFHLLQAYGFLEDLDDLDFEYHYYGPYSSKLAYAAEDAEAEGKLNTVVRPGFHSEPYTVYLSAGDAPVVLDKYRADMIRRALEVMKGNSGLVLEVASTIRFLHDTGEADDPVTEVKRRKPMKASNHRIQKAKEILDQLKELSEV